MVRGCLVHDPVHMDRMQVILLEGFDREWLDVIAWLVGGLKGFFAAKDSVCREDTGHIIHELEVQHHS